MRIDVLILVANEFEVDISQFIVTDQLVIVGIKSLVIKFRDVIALLSFCGVGGASAKSCCSILMEIFPVGLVINAGIAGGINQNMGDIVISEHAHKMHANARSIVVNEKHSHSNVDEFLQSLYTKSHGNIVKGEIVTSEHFVDSKITDESIQQYDCVDMEAHAIYECCIARDCHCVLIKCISDNASSDADWQVRKNSPLCAILISATIDKYLLFYSARP